MGWEGTGREELCEKVTLKEEILEPKWISNNRNNIFNNNKSNALFWTPTMGQVLG